MTGIGVLLVDDEPVLVELLRKYLERTGLRVTACTDPADALHFVELDPQHFWLVITDMTLPGMPGTELIRRIRALNPAVHVILASGYPYQPPTPDIQFLQKPFLAKMLLEMIHRLAGSEKAMRPDTAPGGVADIL